MEPCKHCIVYGTLFLVGWRQGWGMRAKYHEIVARIAADIHAGHLKPGDRLPTHRRLAWEHGLSLGTATRVFAELDEMGLTVGEVGRGTFVRRQLDARATDFPLHAAIFAEAVRTILSDGGPDVLGYRDNAGDIRERRIIVDWLNAGREVPIPGPETVMVCAGGQHGLMLSLMAACRPGDVVAMERFTYPVIRQACALLRLGVVEVAADDEGIRPDALAASCRYRPVRMLFTMPNLQNPTSVTMPETRRRALREVIRRHELLVIEDDAYGFLLENPPVSLQELIPERVFHLRSLSKSWAPGLRTGFLVPPPAFAGSVEMAQRGTIWTSAPLLATVATRLIETGDYERVVATKRREIARRQAILTTEFEDGSVLTASHSMHAVLLLPPRQRASTFVTALRDQGVIATALTQFAAAQEGEAAPEGVRLCLGAPPDRGRMKRGLSKIAAQLRQAAGAEKVP